MQRLLWPVILSKLFGRFFQILFEFAAVSCFPPSPPASFVSIIRRDKDGFINFLKSWQVPLPQIFVFVEAEDDLRPEVVDTVAATAHANDGIKFFVASKAISEVNSIFASLDGQLMCFMMYS